MEPVSVNYPDSSLSDLTNPCAEVFVDYGMFDINMSDDLHHRFIDEKIYEMAMDRFYAERLRYKMGGDEGIHLVVSPEQDPLIQGGVNL